MNEFLFAARPLANDLASSLLFGLLLVCGVDPMFATGLAIAFGVGHAVFMVATKRKIAPLQWMSLALVLVFGAASLFTHDARFLMAKPTIIYLILAATMLKRGWMLRYVPPIAGRHADGLMIGFGYVWAGLMVLTGAANLVMAIWFKELWPAFMAVVPMVSKIALFLVHFLVVRTVVKPKVIAEMRAQAQATA